MQSLADQLTAMPKSDRDAALSSLTEAEANSLLYDWKFWARPNQLAPEGDWLIWLILAGRGFGKTRVGAETVRQMVDSGQAKRIAFVAETAADGRDVMVEGDSGILGVYPPGEGPLYEPSKRRLTWKNGATATIYNATEPSQLRGPQHDFAWCDEIAKWKYARDTWDQLQFGLRLGAMPRQVVTTTPRPIELVRELVARSNRDDGVVVTRGSTMDNAANLAPSFMNEVQRKYAGTRLGRQELEAEILDDAPGALWTRRNLDEWRRSEYPEMKRIIVAVDPAVTATEDSDEHGIIAAGQGVDGRGYILEDASLKGSPDQWARRAVAVYNAWDADCIVAEVNQGGDMVAHTLKTVSPNVNIRMVRASRGKHIRAAPVAALYEQGRVSHVGGFPELEDQMALMTPAGYEGEASPDRVDALVWAMSELLPQMNTAPINLSALKIPRGRGGGWLAG